jgi:hypothetical protein
VKKHPPKIRWEGNDTVKRKSKKRARTQVAPLNLSGLTPEDVLRKMLATPPPNKSRPVKG